MKKRLSLICVFAFFAAVFCYSQNSDFKFYSDTEHDHHGYAATANLAGADDLYPEYKQEEILDFISGIFIENFPQASYLEKIGKDTVWLVNTALKDSFIEEGEIWLVGCTKTTEELPITIVFVYITGEDENLMKAFYIEEE